jgi:hypothetical protein
MPELRRLRLLVLGALIIAALAATFALGHLSGRWAVHKHHSMFSRPSTNPEWDYTQHVRKLEYDELRRAIERHREQALAEQRAGIAACLLVMREQQEEIASRRATAEYIAEGK